MQKDYYCSDDVLEIIPEVYNQPRETSPTATIVQQIAYLKEQTDLLQQSIQLESRIQVEDPMEYLNVLEQNLECLQISNIKSRIQCLALLSPSAEKQVNIKCNLPDSANLKKFQDLEAQVSQLESIIGKKTFNYNQTISQDLSEMNKSLQGLKIINQIETIQLPQLDKVNEVFGQVQMLMGICDLLPNLSEKLQQLKSAHEQSVNFSSQLQKLTNQHQQILTLMESNKRRMKTICEQLQKQYQLF